MNVTAWAGKLPSVGHYSGTGDYSSTRPDSDCNINESEPNVNASREHHKKLAYILEWFKLWSVTVMFSQRWFQIVCVFFLNNYKTNCITKTCMCQDYYSKRL